MSAQKLARLTQAWDEAAEGYDNYFVPRFAPWSRSAVDALPPNLPRGSIVVPCCGSGPELAHLVERFPTHTLCGVDISSAMLKLASRRLGAAANVSLVQGDAMDTSLWPKDCVAVVSVFGLQQLQQPLQALAAWPRAVRRGGPLSIIFWPLETESSGPFAWLSAALRAAAPEAAARDSSWEAAARSSLQQSARSVSEMRLAHRMQHPSAEAFWVAATEAGSALAWVNAHGSEARARARKHFLAFASTAPQAEEPVQSSCVHTPAAVQLLGLSLGL